jgi:hypothetical protein
MLLLSITAFDLVVIIWELARVQIFAVPLSAPTRLEVIVTIILLGYRQSRKRQRAKSKVVGQTRRFSDVNGMSVSALIATTQARLKAP